MDNVLCPHCGQAVLGDPQLAGRVIACPACGGQFKMPAMAARPAARVAAPPVPPAPPPVIQTSQPELAPPVIVTTPPQQRQTAKAAAKRPALDRTTLLIAGIAAAALLLVGVGLVVVINWPPGEPGDVAASGSRPRGSRASSASSGQRSGVQDDDLFDRSRPLPPLDQLLGRPFPADHPDAEARIAEAQRRRISVAQGGGEVQIGDISVSDNPISDYGGFVFGISQDHGQPPMLVTDSGEEPLRIPRSFSSDKATVQRFLERHHGAANVRIEQLAEEPYYLAHLAIGGKDANQISHGRSRQDIQRSVDLINDGLQERFTIGRLERVGTVVRAVYRLQGRSGAVGAGEEFLVLNGQVVNRLTSSRGVTLGRD